MRITFQQSGGFGGLFVTAPLSYEADTDDLPRPEADLLRRLVDESGLLSPGQRPSAGADPRARDVFHYRLQITTGHGSYRYDFDDTNVPSPARPLLDHLTAAALKRRTGEDAE